MYTYGMIKIYASRSFFTTIYRPKSFPYYRIYIKLNTKWATRVEDFLWGRLRQAANPYLYARIRMQGLYTK